MSGHNRLISKIITNFILIGIFSFLSSKLVFSFTNDIHWVGFNYYFFTGVFILITLLILNNYWWFTITSLLIILGAILFITYKVKLEEVISSANNIVSDNGSIMGSMKENPKNFSFFFWIMFTITCVTVIGIIIARKVYHKMLLKESKIGEKGYIGERGELGDNSPIIDSPGEICYQHLIAHANKVIEQIKIERDIDFEIGSTHLKNLNFKENLKRIAYSKNFTEEIFKLARCKLGCSNRDSNNRLKENYCKDKKRFMVVVINKIKADLTEWIKRIVLYKKGLMFLESEFIMPNDWDTLYLNKDKQAGLTKNPYDHFPELSTVWGCSNKSKIVQCCDNESNEDTQIPESNYTWNWGEYK
jgi:hypothetical protein